MQISRALVYAMFTLPICNQSAAQTPPAVPADEYINITTTAVPFLRIATDARSSSLGNCGIATSADPSAIFYNAAKLSFIPNNNPFGLTVNYTPWLSQLVDDLYLANISAFLKTDTLQAISVGCRYFSLGNLTVTSASGNVLEEFRPTEISADVAYSRKLSAHFSLGLTLKYIYSNVNTIGNTSTNIVQPVNSGAADISVFHKKQISEKVGIAVGGVISNIGPKIFYANSIHKDYLPTNLGIGANVTIDVNPRNTLAITAECNKLLVPTPNFEDNSPANAIPDYQEYSAFEGMFMSFADAPNGLEEELNEILIGSGLEYMYHNLIVLRGGYFYEDHSKGGRQMLTAGAGVHFSSFNIDFGYQNSTNKQLINANDTFSMSLQILLNKS